MLSTGWGAKYVKACQCIKTELQCDQFAPPILIHAPQPLCDVLQHDTIRCSCTIWLSLSEAGVFVHM